ncbi:MAG: hypothetical protein LBK03_01450 [Bacteroidales bacterium]|jgi:hypothetical protein|nr:hypothetical protein [Bacteroidales bacterium]
MKFNIIPKPETRKFNYKPQFYTPKEEKSTVEKEGYNPGEFAERLHRSWNSRRQRKEKMQFPLKLVIIMLFFAFIVGYVYFKFFVK